MIPTLRSNNGSFAALGSMTIQPVKSVVSVVKQQALAPLGTFVAATPPVRQLPLPVPIIIKTPSTAPTATTQLVSAPTLSQIVTQLSSPTQQVIFPTAGGSNPLLPTHALTLETARSFDPRVVQGFVNTTTKFQPYEQLTGVSQERPEVIMLTNFVPIVDLDQGAPTSTDYLGSAGMDPTWTDAGRYLDVQFQMRALRGHNATQLAKTLRVSFPPVDQDLKARQADFNQAITRLKSDSSALLNLVRLVETQKSQLDLRHDLYVIDPQQIGTYIVQNFTQTKLPTSYVTGPQAIQRLFWLYHPRSYTVADVLATFGYVAGNVQNVFSSSKIWLQLLLELNESLKAHTLGLIDIDASYQRNDANATTLLKVPVKRFGLNAQSVSLPNVDSLVGLQPSDVQQATVDVSAAWRSMYQDVFFRNEEARITALAHLISQEFRYSSGLASDTVKQTLQDDFGFVVSSHGNTTMFDSIMGNFGNNITDMPSGNDSSLASIAQGQPTSSDVPLGVLTFETKYVEGDTGTLTPGGDYYFDRLFNPDFSDPTHPRFDLGAIEDLALKLETTLDGTNKLIDGLNLFSQPAFGPDGNVDTVGSFLSSTSDLLTVCKQFVDSNGNTLPAVANDRVVAVYTQARDNQDLKTQLFLYTMCRISRAYLVNVNLLRAPQQADNTAVVDSLIDNVISTLEGTVIQTQATNQLLAGLDRGINTGALTSDSLRSSLKTGTTVTQIIEQFMNNVLTQFRSKSSAIQDSFTRYSGHLDTVIMMAAFDFIVSLVARYGNQRLVGFHTGLIAFSQGLMTFAISQTSTNNRNSVNELTQRASAEDSRIQQGLLAVTNTMKVLQGSLKGLSNYLQSPTTVQLLQRLSTTLGGNVDAIRMLFSEQQIMMMASTIDDLLSTVTSQASTSDEAQVLDPSIVPPELRDAVFGMLGTGRCASSKAANMRVMTVGIPLGFTQRIKQKVNIQAAGRSSFTTKRNDIVSICVYRVDLQNPDIVFKPQRFMFELSRFPVRMATSSWLTLPQNASTADVINSIPTQNYSQDVIGGTANSTSSGIEYSPNATRGLPQSAKVAFTAPAYDFLTVQQKVQLHQNHVTSQVIDAYIRLLTGIDVAEHSFEMTSAPPPMEPSFVQQLVTHTIRHVYNTGPAQRLSIGPSTSDRPTGGVMFSTTTVPFKLAGNVTLESQFRALTPAQPTVQTLEQQRAVGNVDSNLGSLTYHDVPAALEHLRSVNALASLVTSYSGVDAINRRLMAPKMFDRVFNVIVDPGAFEIDVTSTVSTPYGKQALDLLIKSGDVLEADEASTSATVAQRHPGVLPVRGSRPFAQNGPSPNVNSYVFRERDKREGDLIADQYFVTIETLEEDS